MWKSDVKPPCSSSLPGVTWRAEQDSALGPEGFHMRLQYKTSGEHQPERDRNAPNWEGVQAVPCRLRQSHTHTLTVSSQSSASPWVGFLLGTSCPGALGVCRWDPSQAHFWGVQELELTAPVICHWQPPKTQQFLGFCSPLGSCVGNTKKFPPHQEQPLPSNT